MHPLRAAVQHIRRGRPHAAPLRFRFLHTTTPLLQKARRTQARQMFDNKEPLLAPHQTYYEQPEENGWTPESKRTGVVALKVGMIPDWDKWGVRHPLTALKLENVEVVQVKEPEKHGYLALQVGAGDAKPKRVNKPEMGHFRAAGVSPKEKLVEFRVSPDAVLPVGTQLHARHFVPGQFVNVSSISQGKGFQGVMKKYGFGGQPASHGVSKTHRSLGSTGNTNAGRVFKGKKMPGRMGGNRVTVECLQVYKIDIKRDIIYVVGAVPGTRGTWVEISDAWRKPHKERPPFPTYFLTDEDREQLRKWEEGVYVNPLDYEHAGAIPNEFEAEPAFEIVKRESEFDPFGMHDWDEPEPQ